MLALRPVVVAFGLAAAPLCDAAAEASAYRFDYEIYVGGSQVAEFRVAVERDADRYRIATSIGLVGLAAMVSDWSARSESEGRIDGGRLIPDRYAARSIVEGEDRWVHLSFLDGVVTSVSVGPSNEEDERDPVSEGQRRDSIDPLTALLHATLSPADCGGDRRLFDGRRLTQIEIGVTGPAEAPPTDYGMYSGPATLCSFTMNRLAGFSRRWERERDGPSQWTVWFANIAGDLAVPVRLEADTSWGALRGHLVAIGPTETIDQ